VLAYCSSLKFDDPNNIEFNNVNGKATFNDLRYDMIRHIATFIEPEDIVNWRYVNCLTLSSLSLKKLVEQIFNISGLECISDNEPELAGVMRLAHVSHDPFLLFKFLINDVVKGKKPYNVLFSALILHLFKTFPELDFQEKQECQQSFEILFNSNVESYMIKVCLKKGHFDLVLGIVNNNADLSGKALQNAARLGHVPVVELFLQSRTDIPADYIGWALQGASKNGHTSIVELLLQCHIDISADNVGWALYNASQAGHNQIFELLLHSRTDIPSHYVGWALRNAAESGHMHIVELLHRHTDISAKDASSALISASDKGYTSFVELLLQSHTDIPADYVGWAIQCAAKRGHTPIVELLLQRRTDIPSHYVGWALCNAAESGKTLIVDLLFQRRTDIPSNHVDQALENASQSGHTAIIELICKHQLNMNS
jgi:ankyrin repeat protein